MPQRGWSDERVDMLKQLWARGETATAISVALGGMSRSAILGKVFRLRLAPVDDPVSLLGARRTGRRPALKQAIAVAPLAATHESLPAQNKSRGKSLLELTNESCRFPFVPPPQMAV
jgi:GcrA cell cycle regulator